MAVVGQVGSGMVVAGGAMVAVPMHQVRVVADWAVRGWAAEGWAVVVEG
jgi:hypothetical protein